MSGTLGKEPGVDYMPKAGDEAKFAGKHEIEKHDDRVGNKDDVYNGTDVKYSLDTPQNARMGRKQKESEKVYEGMMKSEAKCNMTEAGKMCPVHGMEECWSMKPIKEGEKVDRMVKHIKKSEMEAGKGKKEAESIAWATANKRGMLDNKNKKMSEDYETQYHVTEDLAVPLLGSADIAKHKTDDTQDEIDMVRTELRAIANKAMHMLSNMPRDHHIEPWVQSKIAMAKEMIGGVHDYMMYSHKSEEDEQTDTPYTPPSNPGLSMPNFSADVNTGQNV